MHRAIANVVFILQLVFHYMFIHVAMAFILPAGTHPLWAIPFALTYAMFIAITTGICYYYILPKKSQKYWEDNP